MKRIFIVIPIVAALTFSACLKDKPNVDFASTQGTYIAEITTSSVNSTTDAPSGGLAYFNGATLSFNGASDPDSVFFTVNIASDYPPTKDVAITLITDSTALNAYNATGPATIFSMFPDSTFDFTVRTGTVKAGSRLDTFWVVFHPNKIDPTQSYMLPISISTAPGTTISGNLSTIYFHAIGNPLAGSYHDLWVRYNTATPTPPAAYNEDVGPTAFIPVTPTQVSIESGTGVDYLLSFTNTNGVLSNFTVAFPSSGAGSAASAGITITTGPTIVASDSVAHTFTFNFTYNNSAGAARNITDTYSPE